MCVNSEVRSDVKVYSDYTTQQAQNAIFLDSTRICLDSTAERKEKIYQNS